DYVGAELKLSYQNTFDSDVSTKRVDLSAGYTFNGGATNVLFAASRTEQATLAAQDRDFFARGRNNILANNPGFFLNAANPPMGATPNIRSINGSPLFGPGTSYFTFTPPGYTGGANLAAFLPNAGRYNFVHTGGAQLSGGGGEGIFAGPTITSFSATLRHQFNPNVQVFLVAGAGENLSVSPLGVTSSSFTLPATAPNNPFGQAIRVTIPVLQGGGVNRVDASESRLVGGIIVKLPYRWQAESDYSWSRSRWIESLPPLSFAATAASTIATGTPDILRDPNAAQVDLSAFFAPGMYTTPFYYTMKDAALRGSGPVLTWAQGEVTLAASVEHRDESVGDAYRSLSATSTQYFPSKSQAVDSLYLETKIPLLRARVLQSNTSMLELQVAARRDEYRLRGRTGNIFVETPVPVVETSTRLSSTDPTVGLRFQPIADITFRASYGTGFLPPGINQLTPTAPTTTTIAGLVDPLRGNEAIGVITISSGGSPTLQPEESSSWSAGVILSPRAVPRLRLSVDWTKIEKTNNITPLPSNQATINNEPYLPGRIIRAAPVVGDPYAAGRITALDLTFINISRAEISAWDAQLDYGVDLQDAGNIDAYAMATYTSHYKTRLLSAAPLVENVSVNSNFPVRVKANAGATWSRGNWSLNWAIRYFDSYLVADPAQSANATTIANQGNGGRVPAQWYNDFSATWRFGNARRSGPKTAGIFHGVELQVGLKNVFNVDPPFDASVLYASDYSPFGDPRLRTYFVSVKKAF
ncbi:MAG: hypothetical protein JWM35_1202, partial [Verrucomicrobia bacterium]|nr:hypothetical protein [Verrucomicrobiota bacterium]